MSDDKRGDYIYSHFMRGNTFVDTAGNFLLYRMGFEDGQEDLKKDQISNYTKSLEDFMMKICSTILTIVIKPVDFFYRTKRRVRVMFNNYRNRKLYIYIRNKSELDISEYLLISAIKNHHKGCDEISLIEYCRNKNNDYNLYFTVKTNKWRTYYFASAGCFKQIGTGKIRVELYDVKHA